MHSVFQASRTLIILLLLSTLPTTHAHTRFTTLFIDGQSQGDGICVRQNQNIGETTNPITGITSTDMACGVDGEIVVPQTCPITPGSTLGFLHRSTPDGSIPGVIDESHKGPCAVYMKHISTSSSFSSSGQSAAGDGWFKIYESTYDIVTNQWCTDALIANGGMLNAKIPSSGLDAGIYLVRVEILALQNAQNGDPQFYVGCAQVQLTGGDGGNGSLSAVAAVTGAAKQTVNIPGGYVEASTPGLTYNIYDSVLKPYPMFGPAVFGSGEGSITAFTGLNSNASLTTTTTTTGARSNTVFGSIAGNVGSGGGTGSMASVGVSSGTTSAVGSSAVHEATDGDEDDGEDASDEDVADDDTGVDGVDDSSRAEFGSTHNKAGDSRQGGRKHKSCSSTARANVRARRERIFGSH